MNYKFLLLGGSDAGYWTFEGGKLVHHGGWAVESVREVQAALSVMAQSAQLKTPGLAESVARTVGDFVQKQLGEHLGQSAQGGTVVIVA